MKQKEYTSIVKRDASGSWKNILVELGKLDPNILDGKHHPCPMCGGKDRWRWANWNDDGGGICNQCLKEKNGDGFAILMWLTGKKLPEITRMVGDFLNIETPQQEQTTRTETIEPLPWSDRQAESWCRSKPGISPAGLVASGAQRIRLNDAPICMGWPVKLTPGSKICGWVMRTIGKSAWKSRVSRGCKVGWIGQVDKIASAERVWIVEGETDLAALVSWFLTEGIENEAAVSSSCGASAVVRGAGLELLSGKNVVLARDGDDAGKTGASKWLKALHAVGSSVSVFGGLESGCDLRDLLREKPSKKAVLVSIQRAESTEEADELEEWPTDVERLRRTFDAKLQSDGRNLEVINQTAYEWKNGIWSEVDDALLLRQISDVILKSVEDWTRQARREAYLAEKVPPKRPKIGPDLVKQTLDLWRIRRRPACHVSWESWISRENGEISGVRPGNALVMANGILDLDRFLAGERDVLIPHTPDWLSQVQLPYRYDPSATHMPNWQGFLDTNLEGCQGKITTLQEICGYILTGHNDYDKFFMFVGSGGNGKSTACGMIQALIGPQNVSSVGLSEFTDKYSLWETRGKRLNMSNEAERFDPKAEAILKNISSSGAVLTYERKYFHPFSETVTFKQLMNTNNAPRFLDTSHGLYRRMVLLNFNVAISDDRKIPGMARPAWWQARPNEMSAILNWALQGLLQINEQKGFTVTEESQRAVWEYRLACDSCLQYLEEHYVVDYGAWAMTQTMYDDYRDWALSQGLRPKSAKSFSQSVTIFAPHAKRDRKMLNGERKWGYWGISRKFGE